MTSLYRSALRIRRWARISSNAEDVPDVRLAVVVDVVEKDVVPSLFNKPNACFIFEASLAWNQCFGIIERRIPAKAHRIAEITNGEYLLIIEKRSITKIIWTKIDEENQFSIEKDKPAVIGIIKRKDAALENDVYWNGTVTSNIV